MTHRNSSNARRKRATSDHLHFDLQVPTKYGWVFVNPYMTLVAAYKRLIQGAGARSARRSPQVPAVRNRFRHSQPPNCPRLLPQIRTK
jgi:hypothetical protein